MRAIVVERPGPADALSVIEALDPMPGPGELSIDVEYAGVGFVDTLFRSGAFALPTPFIPGIEVTGRVRALGLGVDGFEPGQPVAALLNDFGRGSRAGGYAEIAVAHATMAIPVPEEADLARLGAVLVNGVTAWIALHDLAHLKSTDRVLILGASGGLGTAASRLAALGSARQVIGVVGSEAKRTQAAEECTNIIVADTLESSVEAVTSGAGVDVIIDPVGGDLRTRAFELLAPFGRLLILGDASGQDRTLSGDATWLGTRQVIGLSLGAVAHLIPGQVSAALTALVQLISHGDLDEPEPTVLPFTDATTAHQLLETRTAPAKTVLSVRLQTRGEARRVNRTSAPSLPRLGS